MRKIKGEIKLNELIKIKNKQGIISKIKNFIKSLFTKKTEIKTEKHIMKNNEMKENLKSAKHDEIMRLMELQRKFKNEEIYEEDIDDEDYEKLLKLYDMQNQKIKQDIEEYREETKAILKKLKG